MVIQKDYRFDVWLSQDAYQSKPTVADYKSMKWNGVELTLDEFKEYIKIGHSYCHIYRGGRRLKRDFLFSQVVSIDVDDTTVSLKDFVEVCPLKPTIGYESFSNGVNDLYSYRLVYILEDKLSAIQYPLVYDKICNLCKLTNTKDHCGKVLTQLMNGTNANAEFLTHR